MRKDYGELNLQFLRCIADEPYSVGRLAKAMEEIADVYHICGMEAEFIGTFDIKEGKRDVIIYEKQGAIPAGEPLKYTFSISGHRNILIYVYPELRSFTKEEKQELEIYAANCVFYLELVYYESRIMDSSRSDRDSGINDASGYLYRVTELMKRDIPLTGYCAFYFNIKDFGEINKRYGREIGDDLLKHYSEAVKNSVNKDEIAGHLGGDNYMALIKKERKQEYIDFLSGVHIEMKVDESLEEFDIFATVGVWEIKSDVWDPGEVISRPSVALNQAKNVLHQNIAYASDSLIKQLTEQRAVLKEFDNALKNEEFAVFYQPKVDSRNGMLVGAEGLVRWFHNGETISPGVFIPALEETGRIISLDYYVLKRACADIKDWIAKGIEPVAVSVNFSRRDLKDRRLAENINRIIVESGIDKRLIEIELTESVNTEEHGVLTDFIKRLYDMGIMTAIDDFGSGYSSLATLREFQLHTLKLDRSFVNTDDFSWKDEIILKSVIKMASELSMEVLCEGVERDDQLALLNSVGCYVIQGFYYDRPLLRKDFDKRLKNKKYT
ncbi:MAG: GGDEF domain-containing phosphodiesterase [Lachnospiraceae bacterium]|nr:GGDEF domain-containing phosphodiesterase [Lachnospiraceae bacterium]